MSRPALHFHFLLTLLIALLTPAPGYAVESALELRDIYTQNVDRRLALPVVEEHYYAELLAFKLQQAAIHNLPAQFILMVDRSPHVQAALLFWMANDGHLELIGASPVSTGKEGGYEYFETPQGIFEHSAVNPDFRAEGTKNIYGLQGYGNKGMRIFDFGWAKARKTWESEMGEMRLQLHSTDPKLESKLGSAQSKGCIRIPATLNKLLDHYAVLDADYEQPQNKHKALRVLDPERETTPWSGRYMIIVDSRRITRPDWSTIQIVD